MKWIKTEYCLINLDKLVTISHENYEREHVLYFNLENGHRFGIDFTKEYDTLEKCLEYLGIDLEVVNTK